MKSAWWLGANSPVDISSADSAMPPAGYHTIKHFSMDKANPSRVEVGECPGNSCFQIQLGSRFERDKRIWQTLYLSGGGVVRAVSGLPEGGIGYEARILTRLTTGWINAPDLEGRLPVDLPIEKGASQRFLTEESDILFIVSDWQAQRTGTSRWVRDFA